MSDPKLDVISQAESQVWQLLKTIIDPELGIDIVSLGLIYQVKVSKLVGNSLQVTVVMTLTSPGCPLARVIDQMVRDTLSMVKNLDADQNLDIRLTFDPPWTPEMMTQEARLELESF